MNASRLALLAVASLAARPALAQIIPVSRFSEVSAWEHFYDLGGNDLGITSMSASTDDFLAFDRTVSAGGYTSVQRTLFDASSALILCSAFGTPVSMGFGAATSHFVLTFDLAGPADFHLEGEFARFIGESYVTLVGPGVDLRHDAFAYPAEPLGLDAALGPGRYTLTAHAESDFGAVSASVTVIPAPAAVLPLLGLCVRRQRRDRSAQNSADPTTSTTSNSTRSRHAASQGSIAAASGDSISW